jgi:hypothetical protein
MMWDVFVSHASEDKADVARPLADMLKGRGLKVWYDEYSLQIGDSLRKSIDKGLAQSRYGIVILSPHFFEKKWPQSELDGLVSLESSGKDRILPVWHKVTAEDVRRFSPMFAGRVGISTDSGMDNLVAKIIRKVCLYRVADHHGRPSDIDVSECKLHGLPIVPAWLADDSKRIGSAWLVDRLKEGVELRLYFKADWCDGTWFVIDVLREDGVVVNPDQLHELMPSTATTTTTTVESANVKMAAADDGTTDEDRFNQEIEAIRSDVRSQKNYSDDSGWEIIFHPTVYQKERWDEIGKLEQVVLTHSLNMRNRFPDQRTGTFATAWGIANPTYWETWAFSKSGVFYFNKPFEEDGKHTISGIREYITNNLRQTNEYRVQRFLEQLDAYRWANLNKNIDTIMKTFAFMRRLVEAFGEGETLHYRYCVRDLKERYLFSFDTERHMFLDPEYRDPCRASSPLVIERVATVEDVIANWQKYCVEVMYRFLELFPGIPRSKDGLMGWVRQYTGEKQA